MTSYGASLYRQKQICLETSELASAHSVCREHGGRGEAGIRKLVGGRNERTACQMHTFVLFVPYYWPIGILWVGLIDK